MRGSSTRSVGDREMIAVLVAKTNECEWCTQAHAAVAKVASGDGANVGALQISRPRAIEETLRSTLRMLRKADARARGGCGRHAYGAGCRCLARPDRGRAR